MAQAIMTENDETFALSCTRMLKTLKEIVPIFKQISQIDILDEVPVPEQ